MARSPKISFLLKALKGNFGNQIGETEDRGESLARRPSDTWEIVLKEDLPLPNALVHFGSQSSDSSFGSWQENTLNHEEEDYDSELAQQVQSVRQSIQESLTYGPLSKRLLHNQLDCLEHLASLLKKAESLSNGTLSRRNRIRLTEYRECLCNNMTLDDDMYSCLIQKKVLSEDLAEEIKSVGTMRRQRATLLDLLELLGDKAFSGFCSALRECGQGFLVETLKSNTEVCKDSQISMIPSDCPSFDQLSSEKREHVVLPISCFPKSSQAIMVDICVREDSRPLLDAHGKPQSRMNDTFTAALIKNRVRLCRELFAEMIFDSLLEDEVLTMDVTEALFLLGTRHRMNQVLLNILPFYGDEAFISFVSALKKTGQSHLAALLEDYVMDCQRFSPP